MERSLVGAERISQQERLTIASGVKVRAPPSPPTWISMTLADTVEARTKPTNGMNMAGKFVYALGNRKKLRKCSRLGAEV